MTLDIKTADELIDSTLEARWTERRHGPHAEVLRCVLRAFVERGGPVSVNTVAAAFTDWPAATVHGHLAALDETDLIVLAGDTVQFAYPFSASPTPFAVTFANGQERFACCATDALGMAAMLGARVHVRSRCHQSGEPLEMDVDPTGPLGSRDVMVWIGKRGSGERACTGL
jgi:Alkylmercury lyase